MDRDLQLQLIRRFFDLRDRGTTDLAPCTYRNPAADYTSPDVLGAELRTWFRGAPLLAGLSGDARDPGDYFCLEAGGLPLLVVRGEDGLLRAFVNVCRHRGSRVAEGRGRAGRSFTCPYHAWVYDTNGALLGQPVARDAFDDVDRDELGLRPVPVAERYGLIFVRPPGGEPMDVDEVLCGAERELSVYGLEKYHHIDTRENAWKCNWKMIMDTFLEAYHIFSLHKGTISPSYFSRPSLFDAYGPNGRFIGVRRSITELEGRPEDEWTLLPHGTIQYVLVPNTLLVHQIDHIELWRVYPGSSPGEARVWTSLYAPEAPKDERTLKYWERNLEVLLNVTHTEDFPQCEQIQASLEAGALDEMVFGRNEPALIHFHQAIAKAR